MRVVKPWHGLPREMVEAPSLEPFQARLDGALSTLMQLQMSLLAAGGWDRWPLKVPSNTDHSVVVCLSVLFCQIGTSVAKNLTASSSIDAVSSKNIMKMNFQK